VSRIGPIVQTAYLVSNLTEAIEKWSAALDIPLFYRIDNVAFDTMTYRGKPVDFPLSTALGYSGDMQIELLLVMPDQAAQYPEFFQSGAEKLHHYQVRTTNIDALLKEKQWQHKATLRGKSPAGMEICFVDAGLPDGTLLEIVEVADQVVTLMNQFKEISNAWTQAPRVLSSEQLAALIFGKNAS